MLTDGVHLPELVPVLSRGKHRNPRKGACFMELASFLAGERWSDHPTCTHPLLAAVARLVNDNTSDAGRHQLAALIPSVIGLTSDDVHVDARIAWRSAIIALPVAAAERQRVLAVSVLICDRLLADLDGRPTNRPEEQTRSALAQVPHASRWAEDFLGCASPAMSVKRFRKHVAPRTVGYAVHGIASACVTDPDEMLRGLLVAAIEECAALAQRDTDVGDWCGVVAELSAAGIRMTTASR